MEEERRRLQLRSASIGLAGALLSIVMLVIIVGPLSAPDLALLGVRPIRPRPGRRSVRATAESAPPQRRAFHGPLAGTPRAHRSGGTPHRSFGGARTRSDHPA